LLERWYLPTSPHCFTTQKRNIRIFTAVKNSNLLKLSSDGGDSGSRKCKRSCSGTYGGVWWSLLLAGVWSLESGGRFCVGSFDRNLASVAVKMFSHLIYFVKKFYKFCTLNAICKNNAAINCITAQQKR
jgi:hypothetical protein